MVYIIRQKPFLTWYLQSGRELVAPDMTGGSPISRSLLCAKPIIGFDILLLFSVSDIDFCFSETETKIGEKHAISCRTTKWLTMFFSYSFAFAVGGKHILKSLSQL